MASIDQIGSGAESITSSLGNVSLDEDVNSTLVTQFSDADTFWRNISSSEQDNEFPQLTDRWLLIDEFQWKSSDLFNSKLLDIDLPLGFIEAKSKLFSKGSLSTNTTPFMIFAYWRGDMEIKIQINANKFQIGQIQASFYYCSEYDQHSDVRSNVYCRSQMQNIVLTCGVNNTGTIDIPFKYFKPYLPILKREDSDYVFRLGSFQISVLSQLQTSDAVYNSCNISIFGRMKNCSFSGMVDPSLLMVKPAFNQHEMMSAALLGSLATKIIDKYLGNSNPDTNRDNPPIVAAPSTMVPQNSRSWAAGDNIGVPINMLRLDPTAQTPHKSLNLVDEMTVEFVKSKYGLLTNFDWNMTDPMGEQIYKVEAAPLLTLTDYDLCTKGTGNTLNTYYIPPISVLTSLYAYWRGSVVFKFVVVCSPFHTGRLMISYVPRYMGDISLAQARSSMCAIVDIQNSKEIEFCVPFVSDRPWWHRRYNTAQHDMFTYPPGCVRVYVLNPLVPMESVVNKINILVYIKGGDDFEVSVPASPCFGLSINTNVLYRSTLGDLVYLRKGYPSFYAGTWHSFGGGKKAIGRWGTESDRISQVEGALVGKLYELVPSGAIKGYVNNSTTLVDMNYMVAYHNEGYWYPILFSNKALAYAYASSYSDIAAEDYKGGGGPYIKVEIHWKKIEYNPPGPNLRISNNRHENDDIQDDSNIMLKKAILTTRNGMVTFNEDFGSLKTLCRRMQYLGRVTFSRTSGTGMLGVFTFPACPQGLMMALGTAPNNIDEVLNRGREGTIPLIASGYRFFRGSLRYRLVLDGNVTNKSNFFVQHRPDIVPQNCEISLISTVKSAEDVLTSGYSFYGQNSNMNNIIELEVPFYQQGEYGLLQMPKFKDTKSDIGSYCSLGSILVATDLNNTAGVQIYFSYADDMKLSVFQGYTPLVCTADIGPIYAGKVLEDFEYENDDDTYYSKFLSKFAALNTVKEKITNNIGIRILKNVENVTGTTSDGMTKLRELMASCANGQMTTTNENEIMGIPKSLLNVLITNIAHVVNNCTISTVAIAVVSIMVELGLVCYEFISKLKDSIMGLISKMLGNEHQAPATENVVAISFVTTITCALTYVFGKTISLSMASKKNFAKILMLDIKDFCLSANCMTIFVRNNFRMLTLMLNYVATKISPRFNFLNGLVFNSDRLKIWAADVCSLTSEENREEARTNMVKNLRVYECASIASELTAGIASGDNEEGINVSAVMSLSQRIFKLRDELVKEKMSPPVRFEPFVLYMYGGPGVGKSFLSQHIDINMVKSTGYRTYGEPRYVVTPGNAYWNSLRNQPICQFDDFCAMGGEMGAEEISHLFKLKSTAIFNPPQAELENKHIRYNPLLVTVCSNLAFPTNVKVNSEAALWRRRDILVKVSNKYKDLNEARSKCDISKFEHLLFFVHDSVIDNKHIRGVEMNYVDFFLYASEKFRNYVVSENKNYQSRLKENLFPADEDFIFDAEEATEELADRNVVQSDDYIDDVHQEVTRITARVALVNTLVHDLIDFNVGCEHRRFIPQRFQFDVVQQHFFDGDHIIACTSCGEGCIWDKNKDIKLKQLEIWMLCNPDVAACPIMLDIYKVNVDMGDAYMAVKDPTSPGIIRPGFIERWKILMLKALEMIKSGLSKIFEYGKYICIALGCLAPFFLISAATTYMSTRAALEQPSSQESLRQIANARVNDHEVLHASGDIAMSGVKRIPKLARDFFMHKFNPNEFQSADHQESVEYKILRNSFSLCAGSFEMRCVGIVEHYALCPQHYFDVLTSKKMHLTHVKLNDGSTIPVSKVKTMHVGMSSLCVLRLPKNIPLFCNLIKYMANHDDHQSVCMQGVVFESVYGKVIKTEVSYTQSKAVRIPATETCEEVYMPLCYEYPYSGAGKCGSLLLDKRLQRCIIGMHIGGGIKAQRGYSEIVMSDNFMDLIPKVLVKDINIDLELQCAKIDNNNMFKDANIMVHGLVPKNLAHFESGQAKIVPSVCQSDIYPIMTEPGILSPSDSRNETGFSPMREGVRKQENVPKQFDSVLLNQAVFYLSNLMKAKCKPIRPVVGVLSEEQAICGIWNIPEYESIDMQTSESFPFTSYRPAGVSDKSWLLDLEVCPEGYSLKGVNPLLRCVLDNKRLMRNNGIMPETVVVNCLKQQCLPLDKARQPGKVRIFSMSPLDFTIEQRMYTMDFAVSFQKYRDDLHHAVGIDVHSREWGALYRKLNEKGTSIIDGDFSSFGPTLSSEVVMACYQIISEWYIFHGDEDIKNKNIRMMLGHEMAHAKYLAFQTLYSAFCGSPSGSTLTVIINSLSNILYMYMAWIWYMQSSFNETYLIGNTMSMFNEHVVLVVYGDDVIISVSDRIKETFNMGYLRYFFEMHNINFHGANKSDDIVPYTDINKATFLKANFVVDMRKGLILAKLPPESISNSFNWVWDKPNHMETCIEAVKSSMPLLVGWGKICYEFNREKVMTWFSQRNEVVQLNSWDEEIFNKYLNKI